MITSVETVHGVAVVPFSNPGFPSNCVVVPVVTVKLTVAVRVLLPPVPVTVIVYVPAAVEEPTVNVNVEDPAPGAAMEVGLNAAVVPVGRPLAERATSELNPPEVVVVITDVPGPP